MFSENAKDYADSHGLGLNDNEVYGYWIVSKTTTDIFIWSEDKQTIEENKDVIAESFYDCVIKADESEENPFDYWLEQVGVMNCYCSDWDSDTIYFDDDDIYVVPMDLDFTWQVLSKANVLGNIEVGR